MLVLAVAATCPRQNPTVILEYTDYISDLDSHGTERFRCRGSMRVIVLSLRMPCYFRELVPCMAIAANRYDRFAVPSMIGSLVE